VPLAGERLAPPNVRAGGPVGDLIKLANAGVDPSVLLAFATNSASPFDLGAEEIIYLNDLGVPGGVVTAILQHDQALKELPANPGAPLPAPPANPPPQDYPAPQDYPGPQDYPPPDYSLAPDYAPPPDYSPPEVTEPVFYDSLSPYGNWIDVQGAGLCWQPSAAVINPSWQPYFDGGHWVYTDCGWYWASDYSWGWGPFHYGRWFHNNHWGWCWAPGTVWGTAWVCWRQTDGYCGWAPLPPGAWFSSGSGLTFYGRGVGAGFSFGLGFDSFAFVPWRHFTDRHLGPWVVARDHAERLCRQSSVVSRFEGDGRGASNLGLSAQRVASTTHRQLRAVALVAVKAPLAGTQRAERVGIDGKTLAVFCPTASELRRASGSVSRGPQSAALRPAGVSSSPAAAPNAAAMSSRSFGQSRPVSLDSAERARALANLQVSTPMRPAPATPRAQPAWLAPRTVEMRSQPGLAQTGGSRSFRQVQAQRGYGDQRTFQAPAEVPRFSSPAERGRIESGQVYSGPPRSFSAPAGGPAPSGHSSPPPPPSPSPQATSSRSGR
jgi:hypothetical protein